MYLFISTDVLETNIEFLLWKDLHPWLIYIKVQWSVNKFYLILDATLRCHNNKCFIFRIAMLRAAIARVSAKLITRGSITEFENIHPVPISGVLIQI
jgi:hypothetical protein